MVLPLNASKDSANIRECKNMANSDVMEDDDFEKLLNSFINDSLEEESAEKASSMPAEEKIRQLETKYDIKVTNGLEGRLETMCNYSKGVYDDGVEKGMEQGMAKGIDTGISGAVDILKRMGMATGKIVEQLMLQYGLSKEDADKYVRQAEPQ